MCVLCVDPLVIERLIDRHFADLRAHTRYAHCLNRVFIEANLSAIDANRIANQIMHPRYGAVDIVCEDPTAARRYGIWTTQAKKEASVRTQETHQRAWAHTGIRLSRLFRGSCLLFCV